MSGEKFITNKGALVTLLAACTIVIISLGIRQTFGMFYFDFSLDLNVTLSQFGFAMGLQLFMWGLFGPVFGFITDRYGGNIAVFIGFIFYLLGITLLHSSYNTGIYFVTSMGILIGIGLGSTAISIPVSIVAKHFPASNRTIAISLVTAAGSFGYFVSPIFVSFTLNEYGWENTLLIFFGFLVIGLFVALLLITPKNVVGGKINDKQTSSEAIWEALRNNSFLYLTTGFFVCGWHIALVATHIPMYVAERGLPDWTATTILAMIGLFNILGTLTSGYLSSKYPKKIILSFIYFLRGLVIAAFIFLPTDPIIAVLFGIMFGFLWLATVPPTNGLVGVMFGTKHIGLLYGIVFFSHQLGSFLGAYLGGKIHDLFGNYDYAWYISIALSIFAGLIHLPIKETPVSRLQLA
ncbi:MAG: MFS transporter [Pelagibacteraceae bacterium]|nr:MFS transporter [Pelagibacteraceae bacterium]PHX89685.1 MAG: MFS transporter [Pelagibacteraceae bacterium]